MDMKRGSLRSNIQTVYMKLSLHRENYTLSSVTYSDDKKKKRGDCHEQQLQPKFLVACFTGI